MATEVKETSLQAVAEVMPTADGNVAGVLVRQTDQSKPGFLTDRYCKDFPNEFVRVGRDVFAVETGKIVFWIRGFHNYPARFVVNITADQEAALEPLKNKIHSHTNFHAYPIIREGKRGFVIASIEYIHACLMGLAKI